MADEPEDDPPAEKPKYDQDFFLDLAAKGKDVWNKWRRDPANKGVRVTFAGVDFSEGPRDQINFEGFEFGDYADFSRCKWRGSEWSEIRDDPNAFKPGRAFFIGAAFGDEANFGGAAFGDQAVFGGAAFGFMARFDGAAFGDDASFCGAAFGDWASFAGAAFGDEANFGGAAFGYDASFYGAAFGDRSSFAGTAFGYGASFAGAAFGYGASFDGAAFGGWARFGGARFKGHVWFTGKTIEQRSKYFDPELDEADEKVKEARNALKKRHEDSWARWGSGPDRFLEVSFARASCDGRADFTGRSFSTDADFTNARFYRPPDFDAAASAARIDFTGVHIGFVPPGRLLHLTSESDVPVRLRRLRKLAEDTKNHDLERDLYIEERKAERGVYWRQLSHELKEAPNEFKKKLEDIDKQQREIWSNSRHKARARNAQLVGIAVKIARLVVHILWVAVMGVYWALADYGRSFVRPAARLIASVFFFDWRYTEVLAPLLPKAGPLDTDKYEHAVGMVALGNVVPFVGPLTIDAEIKKFLFCPSGSVDCLRQALPPEGYQWLVLGQNLLSITLVFFIGLALRNYFKIK